MNDFIKSLEKNNIVLTDTQINMFETFYNDLVERNKTTNLTRITTKEDVYFLHFYDSLMVSLAIDNKESKLLDVGTGAGFPGIPLKIAFKSLDVTMIEATNKKVLFVDEEIKKLGLGNARIMHLRAEDYKAFDTYDYVTLRAVAPLKVLIEYTIPFLKVGGRLISMKSSLNADAEINDSNQVLKKIKAKGIEVIDVTLHIGLGTFRPVKVNDTKDHVMHSEVYEISEESAERLNNAKVNGKRIIAIGTTSVRTLEANYSKYGMFKPTRESTNIFIEPGYQYKVVEALITNFHLPKSTLIMLVSAFMGREFTLEVYKHAVEEQYRFFSFGDAMFIYGRNKD